MNADRCKQYKPELILSWGEDVKLRLVAQSRGESALPNIWLEMQVHDALGAPYWKITDDYCWAFQHLAEDIMARGLQAGPGPDRANAGEAQESKEEASDASC